MKTLKLIFVALGISLLSTAQAEPKDSVSVKPKKLPTADEAINRGLDFLLGSQNVDGSWGGLKNATFTSSFGNVSTYDSWRMGTTGLVTQCLLQTGTSVDHKQATRKAISYIVNHADVKRPSDWDIDNVWGLIYGLNALSCALNHPDYTNEKDQAWLKPSAQLMLNKLEKFQSPLGGFHYYASSNAAWRPSGSTSFTTAAALFAMVESQKAGLNVPSKMFKAAVKAVERSRLPNGAFGYTVSPQPNHLRSESISQIKGSLGRIQAGHASLKQADSAISDEALAWGLDQFFEHHKFLDCAIHKPIPHESWYGNAAYFYLFGHYYASKVFQLLPEKQREQYRDKIQHHILKIQQKDGSFWDFYIASCTKPYGTAFAVMSLHNSL